MPFGHPRFGKLIKCECLMRQSEEEARSDLMRFSSLDAFRERTFATFDPKAPGIDRAYEVARKYAKDPLGWLLFVGNIGTGKTHLAAAIAHEALRQGNQVLFTIVPDLLDHLRGTFAPSSTVEYDEQFERVRSAGLLILDDLGTENATPWAREKLFQIINYRYNYRQPTVITTNRRLAELEERMRSRICDATLCEQVEFSSEDYRLRRPGERRRAPIPQGRR